MEDLPIELRRAILDVCPIDSIKSIRQTCVSWASIGEEYLLSPNFTSLPHRDDLTRLYNISQHTTLSEYVRSLKLNMGEMNDYQARHNVYFIHYTRDPELRQSLLDVGWKEYAWLQKDKASLAENCQLLQALQRSLGHLPNLQGTDIRLTECPYDNEMLQRLWKISTTKQGPRRLDMGNFYRILKAAQEIDMKSLSHDRLPIDFFRYSNGTLEETGSALRNLMSLRLTINTRLIAKEDISALMPKLAIWVQSAPFLHTLELLFESELAQEAGLVRHFEDFTWPGLHTLSLPDSQAPFDEILPFVLRHARTLRRFDLGTEATQWQTSLLRPSEFCARLKDTCRELEKFQLRGLLYGFVPDKICFLGGLYDETWKAIQEGGKFGAKKKLAEEFEAVVARGETWDPSRFLDVAGWDLLSSSPTRPSLLE